MICLAVTGLMTGLFLGHLDGLGIGTVLAAFTMGKVVGLIGDAMDQESAVCICSFQIKKEGCYSDLIIMRLLAI